MRTCVSTTRLMRSAVISLGSASLSCWSIAFEVMTSVKLCSALSFGTSWLIDFSPCNVERLRGGTRGIRGVLEDSSRHWLRFDRDANTLVWPICPFDSDPYCCRQPCPRTDGQAGRRMGCRSDGARRHYRPGRRTVPLRLGERA